MTKSELVDYIKQEITVSCSLPIAPPDAEIERIISLESKWLYREYREATDLKWCILRLDVFRLPEFRQTRTIQLPECIIGINSLQELNNNGQVFGINDPDMSFDRMMTSDLYLSPWSSDQITYRTIQWSFWDLTRSFLLTDIRHNFNMNTHRLQILGRDPVNPVLVEGISTIPEEDFYEDPVVIKWFIAKAKISLAKMLGMFNYNLSGNVTVNFEQFRTEGEKEIEDLKTYIKENQPCDWFISFN